MVLVYDNFWVCTFAFDVVVFEEKTSKKRAVVGIKLRVVCSRGNGYILLCHGAALYYGPAVCTVADA